MDFIFLFLLKLNESINEKNILSIAKVIGYTETPSANKKWHFYFCKK
jgi:hypothetical protein